jgi:predicted ATP-dependent serine protease
MEDEDMQVGWNELFQQFVSRLFTDDPEQQQQQQQQASAQEAANTTTTSSSTSSTPRTSVELGTYDDDLRGGRVFGRSLGNGAQALTAILKRLDHAIAFVRNKYASNIGTYV